MPTSAEFDDAGWSRRTFRSRRGVIGQADFPNRIGQGDQVVRAGLWLLLDGKPDDLPSQRGRQSLRVGKAKVIAMWLRLGCQRTQYRSGVGVDVGQGCDSRARAAGSRAPPDPHARDATGRVVVMVGADKRVQARCRR